MGRREAACIRVLGDQAPDALGGHVTFDPITAGFCGMAEGVLRGDGSDVP
jgi:hypothetical protein